MDALKINRIMRTKGGSWLLCWSDGGFVHCTTADALAHLRCSGQIADLDESLPPGSWVEVRDVPKRVALERQTMHHYGYDDGRQPVSVLGPSHFPDFAHLATISWWTDENGVDHVEIVRPEGGAS